MKRKHPITLAGAVLVATALAMGSAAAHSVEELPQDTVSLSPVEPGMGEHWGNPKDLPLGPIFGVMKGEVVFVEFMITQEDFKAGKSWENLDAKVAGNLSKVDHMDIEFLSSGHPGFQVPHYDIHQYFVSHQIHLGYK